MKTKLIIEIETKDNIKARFETGIGTEMEEADLTKEVHDEFVKCITDTLDGFEEDLPDTFEENYIEGLENPKDYGMKVKILTPKTKGD